MCIKHASPILKSMGYDDRSIAALTKGYTDIGFTEKENGWKNQRVISKESMIEDCIKPESDDCYSATHFDPFVYRACAFLAISPTGYDLQSRKPYKL